MFRDAMLKPILAETLPYAKQCGNTLGHGTEGVTSMQYGLYRVEDDASTTLISEHNSIVEGIAAGKRIVEQEDFDHPYSLHTDDGCRVAALAEGRIGYRERARRSGRLDTIHALDDRLDHDVDELVS